MTTISGHDSHAGNRPREYPPRSAVVGWILFDWAAQPYFSLITTFVFAPYFGTHVANSPAAGQAMRGLETAAAGLVIAIMSPSARRHRRCRRTAQTMDRGLWGIARDRGVDHVDRKTE